jgi:ABC-type branched-subunit amino acid transport system ATPase component
MTPLLRVERLRKTYRGVVALDDVSLAVAPGSITGLVGPNGSGKTTLFDCVTGFQPKDAGAVWLGEQRIDALDAASIARAGLRRTFQQLRVFPALTVTENLLTAAQAHDGAGLARALLRTPAVRRADRAAAARAATLLDELGLAAQRDTPAAVLSYGQKKLVELAMAFMVEPRLVLLDEPVAGVNPTLIEAIKRHIRARRDHGITFFVIEHNLRLVFELCDEIIVLDRGAVLTRGDGAQVAHDPRVIAAYFGTRREPTA